LFSLKFIISCSFHVSSSLGTKALVADTILPSKFSFFSANSRAKEKFHQRIAIQVRILTIDNQVFFIEKIKKYKNLF
jgi:hypothetical protein